MWLGGRLADVLVWSAAGLKNVSKKKIKKQGFFVVKKTLILILLFF
jgi:hypothetical protein